MTSEPHVPAALRVSTPDLGDVEMVDCTLAGLNEAGDVEVDVTLCLNDSEVRTVRVALGRQLVLDAYEKQDQDRGGIKGP